MKKIASPKVILLVGAIICSILIAFKVPKTQANPSSIDVKSWADVQGFTNPYSTTASSSVTYLTAGVATTTSFIVPTETVDQADLNMQFIGSTTLSVLAWQVEFSNDTKCDVSGNTCTWYKNDSSSATAGIITHAAYVQDIWAPATVSTTTRRVPITGIGSRFMRVGFTAVASSSEIWAQLALKKQRPY